jgi:hypothetical protein
LYKSVFSSTSIESRKIVMRLTEQIKLRDKMKLDPRLDKKATLLVLEKVTYPQAKCLKSVVIGQFLSKMKS